MAVIKSAAAILADIQASGGDVDEQQPKPYLIRRWARSVGLTVSARGVLPAWVVDAYRARHSGQGVA
jgi:hypothetical protein